MAIKNESEIQQALMTLKKFRPKEPGIKASVGQAIDIIRWVLEEPSKFGDMLDFMREMDETTSNELDQIPEALYRFKEKMK